MSNDIFRTIGETYYLAATLRLPSQAASPARQDASPAELRESKAEHSLLAGLRDLAVIQRMRAAAAARPQGCG